MLAALRAGAPAYLCVDPIEFHGPHLSLRNDGLISRALCEHLHTRVAKGRDWPFLLAGELPVGVEPVPGPGSRHTPLPEVRRLVREACRALAEAGAQRVVLMTFHGSPFHSAALHAGVTYLESLGVRAVSPMSEALRYLGRVDPREFQEALDTVPAEERDRVRAELPLDLHGGFLETSVSLHLAPESVSKDLARVPPCPAVTPDAATTALARAAERVRARELASQLRTAAHYQGWLALRPFPGYTGRPHLASAAAGRVFVDRILERYEALVEGVFEGRARSPEPPMAWAATATLGGRLLPRPALA
jgi:creatinine amidohydrolase